MVTVSQAKIQLSAYIKFAEEGEEVVIMRGSKPAVLLTPVTEKDLNIAPEFSAAALADFEEEIDRDRKARALRKLGDQPAKAAKVLKGLPGKRK